MTPPEVRILLVSLMFALLIVLLCRKVRNP